MTAAANPLIPGLDHFSSDFNQFVSSPRPKICMQVCTPGILLFLGYSSQLSSLHIAYRSITRHSYAERTESVFRALACTYVEVLTGKPPNRPCPNSTSIICQTNGSQASIHAAAVGVNGGTTISIIFV